MKKPKKGKRVRVYYLDHEDNNLHRSEIDTYMPDSRFDEGVVLRWDSVGQEHPLVILGQGSEGKGHDDKVCCAIIMRGDITEWQYVR